MEIYGEKIRFLVYDFMEIFMSISGKLTKKNFRHLDVAGKNKWAIFLWEVFSTLVQISQYLNSVGDLSNSQPKDTKIHWPYQDRGRTLCPSFHSLLSVANWCHSSSKQLSAIKNSKVHKKAPAFLNDLKNWKQSKTVMWFSNLTVM